MKKKKCNRCKKTMVVSNFYKDGNRYDGISTRCKKCDVEYRVEKAKKRPRVYKDLHKRYYEKNKEAISKRKSKYRRNNQEKIKAHHIVRKELQTGNMKRGVCEVCGYVKTDAHHDDYSKPLNVRWLCRRHHMRLHFGKW